MGDIIQFILTMVGAVSLSVLAGWGIMGLVEHFLATKRAATMAHFNTAQILGKMARVNGRKKS